MTLYIITGPPCAGKSTYAQAHAKPGDMVIDLDRIALSIAAENTHHHSYPLSIRNTARLMRKAALPAAVGHARKADTYLIDSKPGTRSRSIYKKNNAVFIELTAPLAILVERCQNERPPWVMQTLLTWWEEPDEKTTRRHA
jgi:tRNA uridine 5-carbamoylmethylation protein Kti12